MKQERDGSISEILKAKLPISEAAERLSVSRPTLYKYMDFYDSGETERIPRRILEYFDKACEEDMSTDLFRLYLMQLQMDIDESNRRISEGGAGTVGPGSDGDRLRDCREQLEQLAADTSKPECTGSGLSGLCVHEDGVTTVFIRGGIEEPEREAVKVYLLADGDRTLAGRYIPEPGMRFVRISNLPRSLDYEYEIEQTCGSRTLVSETFDLITE